MVRVREIREVISPVREVQREILVSIAPVVTNPLVTLDDEGPDTQSLEPSRDVKTTDRSLAFSDEVVRMMTYQ